MFKVGDSTVQATSDTQMGHRVFKVFAPPGQPTANRVKDCVFKVADSTVQATSNADMGHRVFKVFAPPDSAVLGPLSDGEQFARSATRRP